MSDSERVALQNDLLLMRALEDLFVPHGIKGAAFDCAICHERHYFDWALMEDFIEDMLDGATAHRHEPPADPDPEHYIPWDYACGLLDGYACAPPEGLSVHLLVPEDESFPPSDAGPGV